MPDFRGRDVITLQPDMVLYPVGFVFTACSAPTANDGSIPHGTTISTATVTAEDENGTTVNDLVDDGSVAITGGGTVVNCTVSYPSTSGDGVYTLAVHATLNTNAIVTFDAKRVVAGDRSS